MNVRLLFVGLTLALPGCGEPEDPGDEPGLETGPCLSGQQCAAGLVCASELCVDLGGSGEGGESRPGTQDSATGGPDQPGADDAPEPGMDADAGADDAGMGDADAGEDADPTADPPSDGDAGDDAGAGGWCPVPPEALSCTTACDLFQFECYECPHEPGDLCTYYDYQYDACLTGCEAVKSTPGDFVYEVFACRQFAGNDCGDADVDCLLEIDCSGL